MRTEQSHKKQTKSTAAAYRAVHILLGVQSIVVFLGSLNRLTDLTAGYVAANEFLRWVDFNNMLILPLISVIASYLLKRQLEYDSPARNNRNHLALNLTFLVGVYLLAAGYGNHEITNYLHFRFCADGAADDLLCLNLVVRDSGRICLYQGQQFIVFKVVG